jgi:hypothetical protein
MTRLLLLSVLGLSLGSAALAQTTSTYSATGNKNLGKPLTTLGRAPVKLHKNDYSAIGANVPTTPQIALHPSATVGSGTPLVGPGGSAKSQ